MQFKAKFLGSPELYIDSEPAFFPFRKAQVLALILIAEKSITKDKACGYLWSDKTSDKARRNLSNALSCVKKLIPVNVGSGTISLDPKFKVECDTDLVKNIDTLSWHQIKELCKPFMDNAEIDDVAGLTDWLLPKRQYYHDLMVKSLKHRAQARLAGYSENKYEDAVHCYEILSEFEPYDEKIHAELVRLYIKTKQRVKAVYAARNFANRIETDLGMKSDLTEISTLMKRNTDSSVKQSSLRTTQDFNPLERSGEIMKMLDFFTTESTDTPLCGMVWGEQGIGKTVFINEIVSRLTENGWECYTITCWQEEKSYPLAPVMRFLKSVSVSANQNEEIKAMSDLNYSYIADLIYNKIAERNDSTRRLLVIENLQWMDDASWNIMETLMCDARAGRNILVSGFSEIRPAFMLRTALADEPFEKFEVMLRRFNFEETRRICHEMASEEEWTEDKIQDIYSQTEGNPFFIRELLKYNPEERASHKTSYKNTYRAMIELLENEERLFLEAIAVAPECGSMKETAEILEVSPLAISKIFNNIRLHGFLREQEAGGDVLYYFTHTKIREALMDGMSVSRKMALHSRAIEILEKHLPKKLKYRNKKLCARIAYHAKEAGMSQKELFWILKELELHFMAVHEVFPTLVDQDLMQYIPAAEDANYTQMTLSNAWMLMDRLFRVEGASRELLCMERDFYILKGGYLWWSGNYEDAYQILRGAMRKAVKLKDPEPIIKAGVQICYLAIQQDDAKRLRYCAKKLRSYAASHSFKQWEGIAYRFMGIASILSGQKEKAEKYLLASTMIFEKLEDCGENYTVCIIAAEHFRGDVKLSVGNMTDALAHYKNCIDIGESVALFRGLGLSFAKAALCSIILEKYDDAEKLLQRMGKFYNIMHTSWEDGLQGGGIAFSLMGLINCRKKDWQRASMCYAAAEKLANAAKRPVWLAVLYWSKHELFKLADEMPEGFEQAVIKHSKAWYERELIKLKRKIGWE
ncbi:MAG: AAA family ATPase [Synergistes sp.]|nr:AAA family ATPase [Synergistes sp.]